VPCLLSDSHAGAGNGKEKRKTRFTVEAVSTDSPAKKNKKWIGINQNAANRYVEHFIRTGQLRKIFGKQHADVQREVRAGKSRLDFLVGNIFAEVKTPLSDLQTGNRRKWKWSEEAGAPRGKAYFERLIRHYRQLAKLLKGGRRAVVILCFMYDAPAFVPPPIDKGNAGIIRTARSAEKLGVERWQVNMEMNGDGVQLVKYRRLAIFPNSK
jgi:sugar fermentation stimulation protein A